MINQDDTQDDAQFDAQDDSENMPNRGCAHKRDFSSERVCSLASVLIRDHAHQVICRSLSILRLVINLHDHINDYCQAKVKSQMQSSNCKSQWVNGHQRMYSEESMLIREHEHEVKS